jgi:uncharacterized protein with ATP-grasp and redox domains
MKTRPDCIPCFLRQAQDTARLCGSPPEILTALDAELSARLRDYDPNTTPAELSVMVYDLVAEHTGCPDPYARVRSESVTKALAFYPELRQQVQDSEDPLLAALRLAIIGNLIDYGILSESEIESRLHQLLARTAPAVREADTVFFAFPSFRRDLGKAKTLLYLGDNAGETVFDRVLMETIKERWPDKRITFAVRGKAIINDALIEDARASGIAAAAEIVSSGSPAAGTVLSLCSKEFRSRFGGADLVISKGQGNFEALSAERGPIYFLLVAKCAMIARHVGCPQGSFLLLPAGWQAAADGASPSPQARLSAKQ